MSASPCPKCGVAHMTYADAVAMLSAYADDAVAEHMRTGRISRESKLVAIRIRDLLAVFSEGRSNPCAAGVKS